MFRICDLMGENPIKKLAFFLVLVRCHHYVWSIMVILYNVSKQNFFAISKMQYLTKTASIWWNIVKKIIVNCFYHFLLIKKELLECPKINLKGSFIHQVLAQCCFEQRWPWTSADDQKFLKVLAQRWYYYKKLLWPQTSTLF